MQSVTIIANVFNVLPNADVKLQIIGAGQEIDMERRPGLTRPEMPWWKGRVNPPKCHNLLWWTSNPNQGMDFTRYFQ